MVTVPEEKGEPMLIETNKIRHLPLNELDYHVILTLAKNNMRATETAYDLDVHRGTVLYRIEKIKHLTGLDPRVFYDLCELVEMARKEVER